MALRECGGRCAGPATDATDTGSRCQARDREIELRDSSGSCPGPRLPGAVQYSHTSSRGCGAPLLLEMKRAFVRRRSAEVERLQALLDRRTSASASTGTRWRSAGWPSAAPTPTAPRRCRGASTTIDPATGRPWWRTTKAREVCGKGASAPARRGRTCRPACPGRACCGRTPRRTRPTSSTPPIDDRQPALLALAHLVADLPIEPFPLLLGASRPAAAPSPPCAAWASGARRAGGVPQFQVGAARRAHFLDRALEQRPFDFRAVGHHAAVVHERQRHAERAEQAAAEEHERQHAGDAVRRRRPPDTSSGGRRPGRSARSTRAGDSRLHAGVAAT